MFVAQAIVPVDVINNLLVDYTSKSLLITLILQTGREGVSLTFFETGHTLDTFYGHSEDFFFRQRLNSFAQIVNILKGEPLEFYLDQ